MYANSLRLCRLINIVIFFILTGKLLLEDTSSQTAAIFMSGLEAGIGESSVVERSDE